jgi:hypothetical protein
MRLRTGASARFARKYKKDGKKWQQKDLRKTAKVQMKT